MSERKTKDDVSREPAPIDLRSEAKEALKHEIHRRGLTYKQVAQMLRDRGWKESYSSVNQRIARGTYKMTFFIAVMSCIGATDVHLRIPENLRLERDEEEIETAE
ncbi:DUF6471 domain-containing protein [Paraburkholderia caledonica]|uniref:DUF6471 domain-containing protein n=1 Tax=Paraburkholderia caledonica TaxID=134536 RepID=UPI000B3FC242|nr:DUF6471 domain-containing protein [Paraburkholderia caledonica]